MRWVGAEVTRPVDTTINELSPPSAAPAPQMSPAFTALSSSAGDLSSLWVPSVQSQRSLFWLRQLSQHGVHTVLTGPTCEARSAVLRHLTTPHRNLDGLGSESNNLLPLRIAIGEGTHPTDIQAALVGRMLRPRQGLLCPPHGKRLLVLVEDLHLSPLYGTSGGWDRGEEGKKEAAKQPGMSVVQEHDDESSVHAAKNNLGGHASVCPPAEFLHFLIQVCLGTLQSPSASFF